MFTEANDGGSRGKVYLILSNALCMCMDVLLFTIVCLFPQYWDDHPAIMAVGVVDANSEAVFQTLMSLGQSRSE